MFKFKIFFSVSIFSSFNGRYFLLLKIETREIDKKIYSLNKKNLQKIKILMRLIRFFISNFTFSDREKINHLAYNQYIIMEYSNIFLSMSEFLDIQNKIVHMDTLMKKKKKK